MATIKEVAQLAGVSIGTVSNVLNGKTSNAELIDRVESAMRELNYRPDANARSLKREKSGVIGLILPNATNPEYSSLLSYIETMLNEKGYCVLILFTQNNLLLEKNAIDKCLEQRVDGILLFSSLTRKAEALDTPVVLITERENNTQKCDAIVIDYSRAFEQLMDYFDRQGMKNVALIIDESFLNNETIINLYNKRHGDKNIMKIADYRKERGFKAAYELLFSHPELDAIVAGSYLIAQGVQKAIKLLKAKDIKVAVIKEENWIEDEDTFPVQISLSQKKIAERIISRAFEAINHPKTHEPLVEKIHAEYKEKASLLFGVAPSLPNKKLRFVMYDSPTSKSLEMLSKVYMQQTGIQIDFDLLKYDELERVVFELSRNKNSDYDGVMLDITWIDELVKQVALTPLDTTMINFADFIEGIEQQCGYSQGKYYAVPIMSGTQLIFYQKDLFENESLKRLFARMYGKELMVPTSWAEYNLVAEFFTRSYNSKSPVQYGVTQVTGENIYTTISYLNRLWSYGSDVFDNHNGKVILNNRNSITALTNFLNSFNYTSDHHWTSWDEVVEEFKEGNSAMTILYDSYTMDLNDYSKSKVAGNLGVGHIPGGTPVLGGWSLGINTNSLRKKETESFLAWASSDQTVIPLALLGGSTLKKSFYESNDLADTYPWKNKVLESYKISRRRLLPKFQIPNKGRNYLYSHVISKEIVRVLDKEINEEQAISNIENELNRLIVEDPK